MRIFMVGHGLWLSLVERCVRDAEVVGSNPTSPTTSLAPPPSHPLARPETLMFSGTLDLYRRADILRFPHRINHGLHPGRRRGEERGQTNRDRKI